jgi:hypothetical protein
MVCTAVIIVVIIIHMYIRQNHALGQRPDQAAQDGRGSVMG